MSPLTLPATAAALTCSLGGILALLGAASLAAAGTDPVTQPSGPAAAEASAAPAGGSPTTETAAGPSAVTPNESAANRARVHQDLPWDYCGQRPAKLGPATAA
ncbi:MAG TPA: hypothetical protein VLM84_00610, partial [Chromatiaceae bacterium]|nr:hypothetical protein [Chromatiaceae bacterium]